MYPRVCIVDVPVGIHCECARVYALDAPGCVVWIYPDVDVFSRIYTLDVPAGIYSGCTRRYILWMYPSICSGRTRVYILDVPTIVRYLLESST